MNQTGERPMPTRQLRRMLLVTAVVYSGLCAYAILSPHTQQPRYLMPDSFVYVQLANNLLSQHHFSRQSAPPFLWEPYRTPGYPVLLALGQMVTGQEWGALCFVPLFAALLVWSTVGLTHELWESPAVTTIAGWLAVFFPPSLGLAGLLLTDYVHGCLIAVAFYLTLLAVRKLRWSCALAGALAWSACQWIRPPDQLVGVFVVLIALWQARRAPQLLLAGFLAVSSLLTPLYLGYRMHRDHGVFSVSLLGRMAIRYYLFSEAEAMATGGEAAALKLQHQQADARLVIPPQPTGLIPDRYQVQIEADISRLGASEGLAGHLYHVQGQAIHDALSPYRGYVVIALLKACARQSVYPWYSLPPFRAFRSGDVTPGSKYLSMLTYWLFLGLAIAGSWSAARQGKIQCLVVFWVTFVFWIVTGSMVPTEGSRYRFPGDLLLIPLAAYGWSEVSGRLRLIWPSRSRIAISASR